MKVSSIQLANSYYSQYKPSFSIENATTDTTGGTTIKPIPTAPNTDVTQFKKSIKHESAIESLFKKVSDTFRDFIELKPEDKTPVDIDQLIAERTSIL